MIRLRSSFWCCLLLLLAVLAPGAEPTVGFNGWTNVPGVREGVVTTRPVNTTLPKPPLGYVEYLPKGYDAQDTVTKWPLLVMTTGLGEVGDGTDTDANGHQLFEKMTRHGPLYMYRTYGWDFPCVVIVPQQPGAWNSGSILRTVVDYTKANYRIDSSRIYMTGLCDGAAGILSFAALNPTYLAGILPIEGGTPPSAGAAATIKNLPMWAVHCFADNLIARPSTIAWVDQTTQADVGASDVMSTYPGYAGKNYHYAVDSDPVSNLPLDANGPTQTVSGCTLTAGSTYVLFGSPNNFGSALFNSWGSTDPWPYARVIVGSNSGADPWVKTGLMFRDSNAAGAKMVMIAQGPNNEVFMQWRDATNGGASGTGRLGGTGSVKWLKLAKSGATYTGSYSTDGSTWTLIQAHPTSFSNSAFLGGLAVTAHNNGTTYTQSFSGFSVGGSAPGSLTDLDIGSPALAGSASYASGTWTVKGGGTDIWGTADQFNYACTDVSGDQTMIVKVGSNVPPNVISVGKPNGLYLTRPYAGASGTQDITIQTPVGYNATAYYDNAVAKWAWVRGQAWDQARSPKRIFTMCWYQDHVRGWTDTYSNGDCWNWLFSQVKPTAPAITTQPQAASVSAGLTAIFSVAVSGTAPFAYQWTRNGTPIVGATAASYTTPATTTSDSGGQFAVAVSNTAGSITSAAAALTVTAAPPVITAQPQAQSVSEGQAATFSVGVDGIPPFAYQWLRDGSPIPGATGAAFTTAAAALSDSGALFSVAVTNAGGGTVSLSAALTVTPVAPAIVTQPADRTVHAGQPAAFSVAVTGSSPLAFQWKRNGADIAGATAATYSTAATTPGDDAAAYSVSVSNAAGTVASRSALLTVDSNSVAVVDFTDYQVIQRTIGGTSAMVALTGTYGGAPQAVQARVLRFAAGTVVVDWTDIGASLAAGSFSGSLAVPQGGWYRIDVRTVDGSGAALASASGTARWGVGINILCIGQSNMQGFGDNNFAAADDRVGLLYGGTAWKHMADPWISGGKASCGPALGNALVAALDIPVGLVPSALGTNYIVGTGTNSLSRRTAANHADPGNVYGQALIAARNAGGVEFVIVSQGANEAVAGTVGSAAYVASFTQMRGYFAEDLPNGATVKFSLSQVGRRVNAGDYDAGYDAIREAHRLLDNGTNVLLAGSTMDFAIVDGTSHYGAAGQNAHGRRFARSLLYALGNRAVYGGPRIAQARFLDDSYTAIRVSIEHRGGSDFAPSANIPGFAVTDQGGPKPVTASRVDGSTIELLSAVPLVGPTTITYLAGKNPAGPAGLFADNQADAEPLLPITVPLAVAAPVLIAPTISVPPQSLSVVIGQPASFSVGASGSAPLAFQWKRNGTAIPGATGTTYALATTAAADTGAQFSVVVGNGAGSVESAAAALTVTPPPASEPTLAINGWTNAPGVVEGALRVRPVNTTLPRPPYGYLDYLPRGYDPADAATKWPLVIYLPSITEAGDGTDTDANGHQLYNQLVKYGPLYQVATQHWDFPAIVVVPQVTTNWAKPLNVKNVLEYAKANYRVDVTRVYMTGNLEGASGVYRFATSYPTDLAAILTIEANTAATAAQASTITALPVWAAHSFANQTIARSISVGWIDATTVAEFGGASDVLASYPGYGDRYHFAVDVDAAGKPANPFGAVTAISGATLTAGSKAVAFPAGVSFGSGIFGLWSGTDAAPFARVLVDGESVPYTSARGYATSLNLTASYAGTSGAKAISIQTPVGYNATAYRQTATGAWTWGRDQTWEAGRPDKRILTLFWYQTPNDGWIQTWGNTATWNWLFSQVKPPVASN